jgi:hypothetical protein
VILTGRVRSKIVIMTTRFKISLGDRSLLKLKMLSRMRVVVKFLLCRPDPTTCRGMQAVVFIKDLQCRIQLDGQILI